MNQVVDMKNAALWYARNAIPIFPLHWPIGSKCSCGKRDCNSPAKHPLTPRGFKDATIDAGQIATWWGQWPDANIGIPTGEASGFLVVDIDPRNGGDESLESLIREHGRFPDTAEQITGGGGRHYVFRHSGGAVPKTLARGIDLKADGGYIVAAPSIHASGSRYQWDGLAGAKALLDPAELPLKLRDRLSHSRNGTQEKRSTQDDTQKWGAGQRNNKLASVAGKMRRGGFSREAIEAALLQENLLRCDPPLSESEVRAVAASVSQYPPAREGERVRVDSHGPESSGADTEQSSGARTNYNFPLTELGNGERLVTKYGHSIRYCNSWKSFLWYDSKCWRRDEVGQIDRLAKATVRAIYSEAEKIDDAGLRKATAEWAKRSERAAQIAAMLKLASSEAGVPVLPSELDANRWLLNVANGTLNLRTGALGPHRKEDLVTKLVAIAYDPRARCPRWIKFLQEVFAPHPDAIPFVQMAAGYSLTADTREECLFLLHGTGRNGKGTYLKLLAAILGEYAGTADFSTFVATRDDRAPRDDVANMHGKRFIAAQESREGAALAESLIKWLTGGDAVRARRLYENSWEFDPTHKLWLATNHKPIIRGTDPAIWSRIRLIPFDVSFEGKEDRTLKTALMDELPGILAWAIEGCLRWQEEGLPLSASVEKATREYRDESDQLGRFIEERCIVGEFVSVLGRVLYSSYKTWAHDAGEPDLTETAFGRRMTEKGFQKRHTDRGKSYSGIALRSENN